MIDNPVEKMTQLYGALQDELSREVFDARLMADVCPTVSHLTQLIQLNRHMSPEDAARIEQMKEKFYSLASQASPAAPFIIYGAGINGRQVAEGLLAENIPFFGFCCRNSERFSEGIMGKPVISPEKVFAEPEKFYVIIAATAAQEILGILREHNFPEERIIMFMDSCADSLQYFEFPQFFHKGTSFIDGGCYDISTSRRFADWCGGEYSNIIAFEPDSENYKLCKNRSEEAGLKNFKLVQAGLSSEKTEKILILRSGSNSSFINDSSAWVRPGELIQQKVEPIQTVQLDDFVRDITVGFIKMDIEGAELEALKGAKDTIQRDRPFLAICVYHRRGDMITIMDYLLNIVPEYRFWLRHHSATTCETVLYASAQGK